MLNISDIPRATLIRLGSGPEQECTAELFEQWLDMCPDPRKEAARTVGALCDAIRQLRNDYDWEHARAERAIRLLAEATPKVDPDLRAISDITIPWLYRCHGGMV